MIISKKSLKKENLKSTNPLAEVLSPISVWKDCAQIFLKA